MRHALYSSAAALVFAAAAFLAAAPAGAQVAADKPAAPKPVVQIAILLDTSGSMSGLIDQAKTQLWKIVTEFAKSSRDGVHPEIEVALYHYGTPSLGSETGYIKQLAPLTTDLDKISEELFKLKTDGGDEYCGMVIQKATRELKWSTDKNAYKAIFIAGNEPFTQGSVPFAEACKEAATKGVIVNTIYCGDLQQGISEKWDQGAKLADGTFVAINQNRQVVHIDAPQDKEIAELGAKLNSTYIAYGKDGKEGAARQAAQDANAARGGAGGGVARAEAKATGAYQNSTWDLADAVNRDATVLEKLKEDDLPDDMKKLDAKGRQDYVNAKIKERETIQNQIKQLSADRAKFVADKQKETSGDKTLDAAIIDTVHNQAKNANLTFEQKN
jgi:hypothetical protein